MAQHPDGITSSFKREEAAAKSNSTNVVDDEMRLS